MASHPKAQFTVKQLRREILKGKDAVPVFGGRRDNENKVVPVRHHPRSKYDPKPWTDGFFRWSTWELTTEPHTATAGELADQRHLVEDLSAMDRAFQDMPQARALAGV